MATYYLRTSATGAWTTTANWSTVSPASSTNAGTYPGSNAADIAFLESTSGSITAATETFATLNMTGYGSSGGTLAWASATVTLSGLATLEGAMTNVGATLVLTGGGVTLTGTPTGSFPTIKFTTAGQTLTSGGFTWGGAMNFDFAATFTLASNWTNNGLTTFTLATKLTGAYTLTCAGGLTVSVAMSTTSASTIAITGGTWSGAFAVEGPLQLGNIVISGTVVYGGTSLTLNSGTTQTGTGTMSITGVGGAPTLNSNSVVWGPNLALAYAGNVTLNGNWVTTGLTTISAAVLVNKTTSESYTANGGVTLTSSTGLGTASAVVGGTLTVGIYVWYMTGWTFNTATLAGTTGGFQVIGASSVVLPNGNVTGSTTVSIFFRGTPQTFNFNGYTWGGAVSVNLASAAVLNLSNSGNPCNIYGLFTIAASTPTTLSPTTTESLVCNAGITLSSSLSGTTAISLTGGTFTGTGSTLIANPLTIIPSYAPVTLLVVVPTTSITYTASSYSVTTTSSTLYITSSPTINTPGMTWNVVYFSSLAVTVTLGSNLQCTLCTIYASSPTMLGSYNINCVNLLWIGASSPFTLTLVAGTQLNVSGYMYLGGSHSGSSFPNAGAGNLTLSAASTAYLNYTGTAANCFVAGISFNNINASSSAQAIFDYGATAAMINGCTNIYPVNQTNIGGGFLMS